MIRPTRVQCALAYLRNGNRPPLALLGVRGWWLDARLRLAGWLLEGARADLREYEIITWK